MIYFSDFFQVSEDSLEQFGAFNISLVTDLPLFIDPFLLFGSKDPEYRSLHDDILKYLTFLKQKAESGRITEEEKRSWFMFPEVSQNWLGFTSTGNSGRGLGRKFADSLARVMPMVFADLGDEKITDSSHLEKAGLFTIGIGRDSISDFTTNLIKGFLLSYTERFSVAHVDQRYLKMFNVDKVYFDYNLERWMPGRYKLPVSGKDYILLTPVDILTKDDNWINSADLKDQFYQVCKAIPNEQLRGEINRYFASQLPKASKARPKTTKPERDEALQKTLLKFPQIVDYYIKYKESNTDGALSNSKKNVQEIRRTIIGVAQALIDIIQKNKARAAVDHITSFDQAMGRVNFIKHVIEDKDGYRIFYANGMPMNKEERLQLVFKLTWFATDLDVNSEVNNGRGPVDFKISKGASDTTLVEFKLASNSQLKKNLENQVKIYQQANPGSKSIKVIMYFTLDEEIRVNAILKELKLSGHRSIVLIDARQDNKPSASKAT